MTKIKHICQLKLEQQPLLQRQAELEKAIHYDWRDLKDSLRPKNIAGQVFSKLFDRKENAFVADGVSQLAARFTKKMVEKAEDKIDGWLKK